MYNVAKKSVPKFAVGDLVIIAGDAQGDEFCTVIEVIEPLPFTGNEDKWTYVIDYNNGLGEDVVRERTLDAYKFDMTEFQHVITEMEVI